MTAAVLERPRFGSRAAVRRSLIDLFGPQGGERYQALEPRIRQLDSLAKLRVPLYLSAWSARPQTNFPPASRVGDLVLYRGQVYRCEGSEPHTRRNGTQTTLDRWASHCKRCGQPFVCKRVPGDRLYTNLNRHCAQHARVTGRRA